MEMKKLLVSIFLLVPIIFGYAQKADLDHAFQNENFEEVIWLSDQLVQDNLKDFETLFTVGKAYNILNEFDDAIPYFEQAIDYAFKDWQLTWAYTELMQSYYSIGELQKAREYYIRSLFYEGTENCENKRNALALLFGFSDHYRGWEVKETENLIFYFQKGVKINDKERYMNERQKAFNNINTFFLAKLPKKIDFFVWKSTDAAFEVLHKTIGFSNPKFCVSHNRHNQSKGHEIAHNISFWYDRSNTRVRFINEGIGVYFDQTNHSKLSEAKKIVKHKKIPIEELWINGENYPEKTLYPIAGAFVEHLLAYDKFKFLRLVKDQTFENAKAIYGSDFYSIISSFNKKLYN